MIIIYRSNYEFEGEFKLRKKVTIIGSGIGGLSAAVRLLSKGYDVVVYEKLDTVGGKVNLIQERGFSFDLTASILMMPKDYKEVFEYVGKDYRDYIEFIKLDPIYRVFYDDESELDFSSNLVNLYTKKELFNKNDYANYIKLLGQSYKKYLISDKYFLKKSFCNPHDFFNFNTIEKALKLKTLTNSNKYISKYIDSEKLKNFLCFQSMYVGISPFQSPNVYTLIPSVSQIDGLWYLKGGMYSYVKALEKLVYELGGKIKTNSNVEEIIVCEDKAEGVKIGSENVESDIVVCNADYPYAMNNLIKKKLRERYSNYKLNKMKYSCSTFILYLGLDKKYSHLLTHNIYIGKEFKANIEAIFKGRISENPSLYIYCPSRIDQAMAPKGKECINVIMRVPNLEHKNIKWDKNMIISMRDKIINTIKNIKGLEDIEDNIIYENFLTPKELLKDFNSYKGCAFGIGNTLMQTNYFRPNAKSKNIKNLYFTGASTHPGSGVSIVLISSKLMVDRILEDD